MKVKARQITVQEMDHRFLCKDPLQEAKICNAIGVIAGIWLRDDMQDQAKSVAASTSTVYTPWHPREGTEMTMYYDEELKEAV